MNKMFETTFPNTMWFEKETWQAWFVKKLSQGSLSLEVQFTAICNERMHCATCAFLK
jgi:hypothetical protein